MSIFNIVKKLLPRIERATVAEDLRTTSTEAIKIVQPAWDAAVTHFKINKLASKETDELSMLFYRNFDLNHASKGPNFVIDIQRRLPVLIKNITIVQNAVDTNLENDILADGLTVRGAFLIRAAGNMSLVTRYLLALLNYIYTVEAKHFDTHLDPSLEICPAEIKYVEQNFVRFAKLFSEYTKPLSDMIDKLPDVFLARQNEDAVKGQFGLVNLDPFERYGLSGFIGNPIYSVRLVIARWQNERYESAKAKKQQLELRLLYLQMQNDKTTDASVMKEIERLQTRIESHDRYLREVEEDIMGDER